jgi:hypothetical protein
MNKVGKKMFGCFTAVHICMICCLELSINSEPENEMERSLEGKRCSFTRTATADVIRGKNAVTPKTNLHLGKHLISDL